MERRYVVGEFKSKNLSDKANYVTVGMAGAAARLAVNPLSAVKIFTEVGAPGSQMGITRSVYWYAKLNGKSAMFTRGALIGAGRILPHYAIQLGVYDRLSQQYGPLIGSRHYSLESILSSYVIGAFSGMAATLVTHPLDLVKTRMVVQGPVITYKSSMDALQRIMQKEGFYRGIYRGLGVSLVGSAAFSGTFFTIYEVLNNFGWRRRSGAESFLGPFESLIFPTVAFAVAIGASHPIDVLRRKIMAQSVDLPKGGAVDIKFTNIYQCAVAIPRYHNIYGYFSGVFANMSRTAPQVGVFAFSLWGLQGFFGSFST